MILDGKFFEDGDYIEKKFGLQPNGPVQRVVDELCITYMNEFTPMQSGVLESVAFISEEGHIVQDTPYAKYQYYGELYVDPITGKGAFYSNNYGFWSRPNTNKVPSGKPLTYDKSKHPKAGPKWFERMKEEYKERILKTAYEVAGGTR